MITIVTISDEHELRKMTTDELRLEMHEALRRSDDVTDETDGVATEARTYWIDLDDPSNEEEDLILIDLFKVHSLALEDCRRNEDNADDQAEHLPKVEDYGDYLFAIINPVRIEEQHGELELHTHQLNAFVGENFIITHHYEHSAAIDKSLSLCTVNPKNIRRGPDYIYHNVLDFITDDLSGILDVIDAKIDALEDEIFTSTNKQTLPKILKMKRLLFQLRRITTYQREMVYRLSRGEFDLISDDERAFYRNVYDHLVRAADLTESYRDVLTGLLDAYLSMTSNRLNEVMKVLTIISTVFLPLTFIVGLYGMNFRVFPEIEWHYGYAFAWGVMLAVAIGMVSFFRHRKWL